MFVPSAFLDEIREKLPLSTIVARKVKLTHKGREYTGLCPFHKEKTPSFTVNDDKGFYHCFGCGAHGDQIKFLMETEKMPFMEVVENLAQMAGLKMPQLDPKIQEQSEKRAILLKIMEVACRYFQSNLFSAIGTEAKKYLIGRGMSSELAKRFRLGFAPAGSGLYAHLVALKFSVKDIQALGLIAANKDGNGYHDYFYDRIMFPVMNRRGQVIGFSGRMLHKGEPKYLNSPETELFHKGDLLYGLPQAIETVRKKNTALVVEGNVDVISLHGAGFTQAMAPLGTAFTEEQIKLLWSLCDEPVICFDGDGAGQKAMVRALNRALPILRPGKSLKFAYLPDGLDPDDMIRKRSVKSFQEEIDGAKSFIWALWQMLLSNRTLDTPERLAKLEKDAIETVNKIEDAKVRNYYLKEIQKKLKNLGKTKKQESTSLVPLLSPVDSPQLLAYIVMYPGLSLPFVEEMGHCVHFSNPDVQSMFHEIIGILLDEEDVASEKIWSMLSSEQQKMLNPILQTMKKGQLADEEVIEQIRAIITLAKRSMLKAEIDIKTKEYLENESPALKEELMALQEEMKELMKNK